MTLVRKCLAAVFWQQLKLCLCYCTVNKWLHGTRQLGLCHGKSRVELVRKPGLTV